MQTFLIVVHILITLSLAGFILLQRSEGGGLGQSAPAGGGLMTARSSSNLLTRITGILATCFFITSILLAIVSTSSTKKTSSILERHIEKIEKKPEAPKS